MFAKNHHSHRLFSLGCFLLSSSVLQGVVVYSGLQNITVGTTFEGVYLDIDTGMTSSSDTLANWDINLFFGGEGIGTNTSLKPVKTGIGNLDPIANQQLGIVVDLLSEFYGTRRFHRLKHSHWPGK